MHRFVAALALMSHMVFMAFTILGGFLAMLAPWVLLPHIACALWGASVLKWQKACPLSKAENWGRVGAGRPRLEEGGFVTHYFEGNLYPASWSRRVEVFACGLVFGSWTWLVLR